MNLQNQQELNLAMYEESLRIFQNQDIQSSGRQSLPTEVLSQGTNALGQQPAYPVASLMSQELLRMASSYDPSSLPRPEYHQPRQSEAGLTQPLGSTGYRARRKFYISRSKRLRTAKRAPLYDNQDLDESDNDLMIENAMRKDNTRFLLQDFDGAADPIAQQCHRYLLRNQRAHRAPGGREPEKSRLLNFLAEN